MRRIAPLLVVLLLAACGGRTDGPEEAAPQVEETSTGLGDERGPKGDGGKSGDGGEKDDRPGGSGSDQEPQDGAPPQDDGGGDGAGDGGGGDGGEGPRNPEPQAFAPIDAGTYEYDTDGQITLSGGSPRDMPATTTLQASAPSGEMQRTLRDLRDDDGTGQVTETHLHYRTDGVYLSFVKVTFNFPGGITDVREFRADPPEMVAAAGAEPGDRVAFTMKGSGSTARVTVEALRTEMVEVDGDRLDAIVVRTTFAFSGAVEGRQESTSWFEPNRLLALREEVRGTLRNGPIEAESEYVATLRSLSP